MRKPTDSTVPARDPPAGLAEGLWRDNAARLRSIFDGCPAIMFVVDAENRFVFVNRAWESTFGLSQAQVSGRSIFDVFSEANAQIVAEQNRRLLASSDPIETETAIRVDDEVHTYFTTKSRLVDENGLPFAVCGISFDITHRRRQESRLRLVSEIASALVLRGDDVDGFIAEIYRKLADELGTDFYFHYRPDAARGRLHLAHSGGADPQTAAGLEWLDYGAAVCGTVAVTRQPWIVDDVQGSADERTLQIRGMGISAYACFPLVVNGTFFGTMSLGRRSGGRFDAEELELLRTVTDLVAVAFDRAQRARALLDADVRRTEFLAVLAHELRGPITPIINSANLLKDGGDPAMVGAAGGIIARQAANLARLVEELLDGARVRHGKITLDLAPVAIADVVQAGIEIARPLLDAREHALAVSLPPSPAYVNGDRRRLVQVVANLLSNAAKFTPAGGHVGLDVTVEDERVTIRVSDDGIGIAPEALPGIFNLFEQGFAPAAAARGGLGIGLSLAKAFVDLHGGSIEARSNGEGRGCEVTVHLPRLPAADANAPRHRRGRVNNEATGARPSPGRASPPSIRPPRER